MKQLILKYLKHLKNNNYSKNTIKCYKSVLFLYQAEMINILSIKNKIIKNKNKPTTKRLHYNCLLSFFKWSKDKRIKKLKQLKLPKIELIYRPVFSYNFLMKKTLIKLNDSKLLQDKKKVIRFLFETGMRANELKNIKSFSNDTVKILGKGNKIREIFCTKKTLEEFKKIKFKFTTKTLRIWVKDILGKKFTPHSIRRSHATYLLLNGAAPKMVMLQLGHKKIETTFRYCHLSKSKNKSIYKKYFK